MTEIINHFCGVCENCEKLKLNKKVLTTHTANMDLEDMNRAKQIANAYINGPMYGNGKILVMEETIEVPDFTDNPIAKPIKLIDKKYSFFDVTDIQQDQFCVEKKQHPMMQDTTSWKRIKLFLMK